MINIKNMYNYSLLLFIIFLSFSVIILFEDPEYHVFVFWLTAFFAIFIAKINISHPLVWFSGSFALYSTAYSLLYILDYPVHSQYSKESLLLSFIAFSVVLLVVGVKKKDSPTYHKKSNYVLLSDKNNKKIMEFILSCLLIILLISVVVLFFIPFEHKNDMLSDRNIFFFLGVYSTRFISFFICFYILLFIDIDRKKTNNFIILSAVLVVLFSLFTGERDAMFRFFVVLVMTLFILNKISKKLLLSLIPIGMIYLTSSVYFKYFFVRGELKESFEDRSFVYNFLTADFSAAGGNLQILVNNPWTESFHSFSMIINDFITPFLPGGILENIGVWFNDTFFPDSYSRAFTLVGQGYVIGGVVGVIFVFFLLGVGIKYLYSKIQTNIYWLVLYIYSIPTIISAFRSTLGTVTTGLVRVAIFSLVIHAFLYLLINNKVKQRETRSNRMNLVRERNSINYKSC